MRPAIAHRHAKALRRSDGDVGAHRARLLQHAQRQKVGRDDGQRARGMQRLDLGGQVADMAIGAGILEHRGKDLIRHQIVNRALDDANAQRRRPRLDHRDGLRVQVMGDKERVGLGFRLPPRHGHRLGRRGRLVQQRCVRHRQPGQIRDHGLEVQQRLQPPLRDLGLIGGIGRVPGRVLQDVALDRGGRDGAIVTLADQAGHHPVLVRHLTHACQQPGLGQRRPVQRIRLADRRGHGLFDQLVQAVGPDRLQHLGHLDRGRADMPAVREIVGVIVGGRPAAHPGLLAGHARRRPFFFVQIPWGSGGETPGRRSIFSRPAPCRRPRP